MFYHCLPYELKNALIVFIIKALLVLRVTLPDNLSNHLMEFFKRIYPLKQVFYKYLGEEM